MEHISDSIKPDVMMMELNEIRERIGQHLGTLSIAERLEYRKEKMKAYADLYGLEFVPDPSFPRAVRAVPKSATLK
jgi:hypothetical protein